MSDDMQAEYDALPEPVRNAVTFKEWRWMPADRRATLETDLCTPQTWVD